MTDCNICLKPLLDDVAYVDYCWPSIGLIWPFGIMWEIHVICPVLVTLNSTQSASLICVGVVLASNWSKGTAKHPYANVGECMPCRFEPASIERHILCILIGSVTKEPFAYYDKSELPLFQMETNDVTSDRWPLLPLTYVSDQWLRPFLNTSFLVLSEPVVEQLANNGPTICLLPLTSTVHPNCKRTRSSSRFTSKHNRTPWHLPVT